MSVMAPVEVREVAAKDLPVLASIPGVERGWGLVSLAKEMMAPWSVFGVVTVNGRPVGYAVLQVAAGEGYLANIVVSPGYRGKGLGKGLLERILERAVDCGVGRVLLEVRESNHVAIGLYYSMGFQEVGRRLALYSDGETAVVMEKRMVEI